jgi:hypothetical protein
MKVIDLGDTRVYWHIDNPITHRTEISISEDLHLIIAFNPSSSLYDESKFTLDPDEIAELKSKGIKVSKVLKPFQFNRWYVVKVNPNDRL